jgi:hypothetical protein
MQSIADCNAVESRYYAGVAARYGTAFPEACPDEEDDE